MELVFLNILLVGAGAVLFLLIRAAPRVTHDTEAKRGALDRWLTSRLPERMDAFARTVFVRSLRRIKVLVLRLDNSINQKLQRMKLESGEGIKAPKIDLKKVIEERTGETGEGDKGGAIRDN